MRLEVREPFDAAGLVEFLGRRAVRGIEEVEDGTYRRSLRLARGAGLVELTPDGCGVEAAFEVERDADLPEAVAAVRALLDLDADPALINGVLARDPLIAPLVVRRPGRRVPGHVDAGELAIRAVLGQQVSLAAAATLAARLVCEHGEPLARPRGSVTHLFPSAARIAALDPAELGMPRARAAALTGLARALAGGELRLDPSADPAATRKSLLALAGIGPWTASYIEMRALGNGDAFLPSDLGVRHALARLGEPGSARETERLAERWRPFRAYALQHLWASLA